MRLGRLHPALKAFLVVSSGLAFDAFTVVVVLPNLIALYREFISH
jgi:hypothetical protein